MLNRAIQPPLKEIDHIQFVEPVCVDITSQVKLFHMKSVPDETARLDLYFDAGKCREKGGIPSFVNGLLLSGTPQKNSIQINDEIDGLGGFFESGISVENSVITVYCLRENLPRIFSTIYDAIKNVTFDEKEVHEYLRDNKQKFAINLEKVSYQAQRNFQQRLFQSDPHYSDTLEKEDFEKVTIDRLKAFHARYYLKGLTKVVVVGNVPPEEIDQIAEKCKHLAITEPRVFTEQIENETGSTIIDKKGTMQTAIRVGRILFNKNHSDYLDFLILNTILGDYFGSRLMSNIREDKGYTYGIGTLLAELHNFGYFMVATEVRNDVKLDTLKEIQYEFERLQNEKVGEAELALVKNYMRGQLLKSADGPYAMTDLFLSAELHGKDLEFYNQALQAIHHITPERIQDLAKKYLNWSEMTIVAYG